MGCEAIIRLLEIVGNIKKKEKFLKNWSIVGKLFVIFVIYNELRLNYYDILRIVKTFAENKKIRKS